MSLIGKLDDYPDNGSHNIVVDQRPLLLVRRGDAVFLYENRCPHTGETLDPMGGSVASPDGLLLTCQRHAAEFITDSGECVGGACQGEYLQAVAFTLSNNELYLD
ncbi:MAG: Rieske 2Fe-2S domain-containing protein [Pseudomonadota bacterium]